jgi:arylsulfatase A-like enzyme
VLADELVRAIESRDRARPLFLVGAFTAVHDPYQAPEELVAHYAGLERPRLRIYAAMIEALDLALGRVLAALAAQGISDQTLLVFFSDNGGVRRIGRNDPLRGAKTDVFEGGVRTPALLRWPGVLPRGEATDQVIAAADLFPTLLRAAGQPLAPPDQPPLDGVDLLGELRSGRVRAREPLFFGVLDARGPDYAVIDGRNKLVRLAPRDGAKRDPPRELLFDLESDPRETRDLVEHQPELRAELAAKLDRWLEGREWPFDDNPRSAPPGWVPARDWSELARAAR